jgi:hypothetical protein
MYRILYCYNVAKYTRVLPEIVMVQCDFHCIFKSDYVDMKLEESYIYTGKWNLLSLNFVV